MSELDRDLDELKAEIERVQAGEGDHTHLNELIDRVDRRLEEGDEHDDDEGFVEHLEELVTRYEVTHPRLTNIASSLINTLSAAGL